MKADYFPMFFDVRGKRVLIFGGGEVAYRRIQSLLCFAVKITVIASEVDERISSLADEDLEIIRREVNGADFLNDATHDAMSVPYRIKNADIILAATSDAKLNSVLVHFAKRCGKWGNNASNKEECDFFFPALVRSGEITIGIAGDGSNHKKVSEMTQRIRECLRKC